MEACSITTNSLSQDSQSDSQQGALASAKEAACSSFPSEKAPCMCLSRSQVMLLEVSSSTHRPKTFALLTFP